MYEGVSGGGGGEAGGGMRGVKYFLHNWRGIPLTQRA